jgi:hypothetical protein
MDIMNIHPRSGHDAARSQAPMPAPIIISLFVLLCISLGELGLLRVDWRPLIETKNDLRSMIVAAEAFMSGQPIYEATNLCLGCYPSPFTYLPGSLLPFVPLAGRDPYLAFTLFTTLSVLIFVAGVAALLRSEIGCRSRAALLLASSGLLLFPVADNIYWGQSQLLLVGAVALGLASPPLIGGILIGVASYYKLYPALLIGAWVLAGDWRRALAGIGTALLLLLASLAYFGVEQHMQFIAFLGRLADFFNGSGHSLANYSLRNHLGLWGAPALLVRALAPLLICAWLAAAWRLRRKRRLCFALTIGATMLISPIVWRSYFLLAIPMAILLYPHVRNSSKALQWIYGASIVAMLTAGINVFVRALAAWPPLPTIGVVIFCGLCLFLDRHPAHVDGRNELGGSRRVAPVQR